MIGRDQRSEIREQRSEIRIGGRWLRRPAFTLPELLVVIAISILLLAIAVPAFSSVLYSSRRSGASAAVQSALAAARDVAVESGPGRDAAAVFFADSGGQLRIMVVVEAGEISDLTSVSGGPSAIRREIFVRSERVEPITLPAGWAVSGRARANTINDDWYETTYPTTAIRQQEHWVYPETSLDSPDQRSGNDGRNRQTFMVRFEGGSGALSYGADRAVLVLDPVPTRSITRSHDPLEATDHRRFVQRVLAARVSLGGGGPGSTIQRTLGDESSDTVLARPVGQVAVYSLRRLARGVEARRLNPDTGSLYQAAVPPDHQRALDTSLFVSKSRDDIIRDMDNWISGQPVSGVTDSDAQIFTVQRYLGRPLEAVAIGGSP